VITSGNSSYNLDDVRVDGNCFDEEVEEVEMDDDEAEGRRNRLSRTEDIYCSDVPCVATTGTWCFFVEVY
jgi:hypothetical protein